MSCGNIPEVHGTAVGHEPHLCASAPDRHQIYTGQTGLLRLSVWEPGTPPSLFSTSQISLPSTETATHSSEVHLKNCCGVHPSLQDLAHSPPTCNQLFRNWSLTCQSLVTIRAGGLNMRRGVIRAVGAAGGQRTFWKDKPPISHELTISFHR